MYTFFYDYFLFSHRFVDVSLLYAARATRSASTHTQLAADDVLLRPARKEQEKQTSTTSKRRIK
jgi:hypothetical protein